MALLSVGVVSVTASALFALLLAFSIRFRYPSKGTGNQGNSAAAMVAGWVLLVLIGMLIATGLWLIIPHFG